MAEVYTCVCGGQKFTIADGIITCPNCSREFILQFLDENFKPKFESAEDFNKRIRIDHCHEYVHKEGEK